MVLDMTLFAVGMNIGAGICSAFILFAIGYSGAQVVWAWFARRLKR